MTTRTAGSTNRSDGLVEQVITISRLIVNDDTVIVHAESQQPATLMIRLEGAPVTNEVAALLLSFLRNAIAGGVKLILVYGSTAIVARFKFDGGATFDGGYAFATALSEATI